MFFASVGLVFLSVVGVAPQSSLQLPAMFSDHMVLQRGKQVNIFGFDSPGTRVTVEIGGQMVSATVGSDGRFKAVLSPMKAGGPYTLKVTGSGSGSVTINDVLVGEVWLCSGQSNMEWTMSNSMFLRESRLEANPNVRMFTVSKATSNSPLKNVSGAWEPASSTKIDNFSAVGNAFAVKLFRELKIPIGMIHSSWGGTVAEAWTSLEDLESKPITKPLSDSARKALTTGVDAMPRFVSEMKAWERVGIPEFFEAPNSAFSNFDSSSVSWDQISLPHEFGDFDGFAWYHKKVVLTEAEANSITTISLPSVDDHDHTYINGVEVGYTGLSTPNHWSTPRRYTIPAGTLVVGSNLISVWVYDTGGAGGINGSGSVKLGDKVVTGAWSYHRERKKPAPPATVPPAPVMPGMTTDPNFPANLYNAMIVPLAPYTLRGAIWYQGESNVGRSGQYRTLLPMMANNWRRIFEQPKFPFYIAQLANFQAPSETQFDSAWAELRDAQDEVGRMTSFGMANILDIGEAADIHPRNKRDVGERLARIALVKDYGKRILWQGPTLAKFSPQTDGSARLDYSQGTGLRTTDGRAPRCFAVCDDSGKWMWAKATILGESVILTRGDGGKILHIRYGWQDNPPVNLVNLDGLPAMAFRTDKFKLAGG